LNNQPYLSVVFDLFFEILAGIMNLIAKSTDNDGRYQSIARVEDKDNATVVVAEDNINNNKVKFFVGLFSTVLIFFYLGTLVGGSGTAVVGASDSVLQLRGSEFNEEFNEMPFFLPGCPMYCQASHGDNFPQYLDCCKDWF